MYKMSYYFPQVLKADSEATLSKVTEALKKEGFGGATEIDVQQVFKKKLDVDIRKFKACIPYFYHEALSVESHVGVMLPCNITVHKLKNGEIDVAAVDPVASMEVIKNERLKGLSQKVREKLEKVIHSL